MFLDSISKVDLPLEYSDKYNDMIQLLIKIFNASDLKIISLASNLNTDDREKYKMLLYKMERDGNNVLKDSFSHDLKNKAEDMIKHCTHKVADSIDVYEFNGEPFTMLVHVISNNTASFNNDLVSDIIMNPEMWFNQQDRNNHISTSLISDRYMGMYGSGVIYGFYNVPSSSIKTTGVSDLGINRKAPILDDDDYNMRKRVFVPSVHNDVNTVTTVDNLINMSIKAYENDAYDGWNEVILSRICDNGKPLVPDYIVCMDKIDEKSKRACEYYGIPIYLINTIAYKKNSKIESNEDVVYNGDRSI